MNQPTRITSHLISSHFPELKEIDISVRYHKLEGGYFEYGNKGSRYYIDISPTVKNSPLSVKKGGLSHELAHILIESKRNGLIRQIDLMLYKLLTKYRITDERRTDMLVVKRGLLKPLLTFSTWRDKREAKAGRNVHPESGMTTQELEALIKV